MDIFSSSSSSLFGTGDFAPVNPLEPQSSFLAQPQNPQMPSATHRLVVIDTGVQNYAELAAGVLPGESVLFLDPLRDGLTQIDEALSQLQNVSSLSLVSHGGPGYVQLGSSRVDTDVLTGRSSEIRNWASSLTPDADILLYGCNVAAGDSGLQFVQQLNMLTDADVAASNNLTGNKALGGDWILETNIGNIESFLPFQTSAIADYQATLATVYLSDLTATSATNGWGPVELDKSNREQAAGDGGVLTLNGATYAKGLGTHAGSDITYALGGNYTRFTSDIGLDDEVGNNGSVVFQVWADGAQIYDSGVMAGNSATKTVDVDVTGKQNLRLVVTDGGNGNGYDHSDWANARLASGPPVPDTTAPTATLNANALTTTPSSTTPYIFTVTYSDNVAVNANSLDNLDVLVTGSNQFSQTATTVTVSPNANGSPLAVTYQITPPGGSWDLSEAGQYTVALQNGQVTDTSGNAAVGGTLGIFNVAVNNTPPSTTPIRIQAEDYKAGGQGIGYNDLTAGNSGGAYRTDRVDIEGTTDVGGGFNVGWIDQGEWLAYDVSVPTTGTYNIVARVAADGNAAKSLGVSVGGQSVATLNFNGTGGWQNWTNVTLAGVTLTAGSQELRLNMLSSLFNVNYIELVPVGPPAPDTAAPTATLNAATLNSVTTNPYTFTVTYTDATAVNFSTINGTSTSSDIRVTGPNNYSQLAQLVSVNPGVNGSPLTATYQITAPDGTWNWNDTGTYTVNSLAGEVRDTLGNTTATDNSLGSFQVAIQSTIVLGANSFNVTEGGAVKIPIQRLGDTSSIATVQYYTGGNTTATADLDYQSIPPSTIQFGVGENYKEVTVQTKEDILPEGNETFSLLIDSPSGADLGPSRTSLITIADNDSTPPSTSPIRIQAEDYKAGGQGIGYNDLTAGNSGTAYRTDNVDIEGTTDVGGGYNVGWVDQGEWLAYNVSIPATGTYNIVARVAADGNAAKSLGVSVGGQSVATLNFNGTGGWQNWTDVTVAGVTLIAGSQELRLNMLSSLFNVNYIELIPVAPLPPGISLASNAAQAKEADGSISFTVLRTGDTSGAASVDFATSNGTATAGVDYTAASGKLNFAVGETQKIVTVPITNDPNPESNETFTLQLSNAVGAPLSGTNAIATATIIDDDLGTFTRESVIGGLNQPVAFDWSPDGQRMYVAQKNGVVRVAVNNVLQTAPFIDISSQVNDVSDRGLLGLAINPNFLSGQPYIYLLFTYDPPQTQGQGGLAGSDKPGNRPARLIRVTADAATNYTTIVPNSEVILLGENSTWQYTSRPDSDSTDNFSTLPSGIANGSTIKPPANLIEDPDPANLGRDYSSADTDFTNNNNIRDYLAGDSQSHSIGSVQFGTDGSLYVTVGDGTSYNGTDWRATRVQDIDNLSGKLLRIDPITGQGLSDNPFYNGNSASNRSKVWSYGFRNPFRFAIQPTTGIPFIGDVGWNTWEEVNAAVKGGNYGWPYFEGGNGNSSQNGAYSGLPQAQAFYNSGQPVVPSTFARNHNPASNADGKGATALIVGDFYTGNTYPSNYNGALFFNDVNLGAVYTLFLNPDGKTVDSVKQFDNVPYIVAMQTGPDGNLYYANLVSGQIGRWKAG
jgi:glucose/arabinose dehydrogenase